MCPEASVLLAKVTKLHNFSYSQTPDVKMPSTARQVIFLLSISLGEHCLNN